jgi:hypothetical protein
MTAMISPAEQLRDRLIALTVEPLVELDELNKHDDAIEVANARGRYESARAGVVAWVSTCGQVAEFQAANVADMLIKSAHRAATDQI